MFRKIAPCKFCGSDEECYTDCSCAKCIDPDKYSIWKYENPDEYYEWLLKEEIKYWENRVS